jgi:radical SAM superfamily enzyme YgiQ (UPF0313 family)
MDLHKIVLFYPDVQGGQSNLIAPLSLIYIGTLLTEDYEIAIIDQRVDRDWRGTLRNQLNSDRVVCAGISSMTGPQIAGGIEAASLIRRLSPSMPIIWGGVHPSLLPEETIHNEFVDIIVVGDGEVTFKELADVLKNGPAYDLVDVDRYKSTPAWTARVSLPLITSRGCPHRCGYCYNTKFSTRKWTCLSPEQTVELIMELVNRYNISGIFLLDDNFFVDLKRVRRICELLIDKNVDIRVYNANCRADSIERMDENLLSLLKQAGFDQLFVGVESGSDDVLGKIGKDITVEQVLSINTRLKNANIKPFYSFMAGFPFESLEDIKKTLLLMKRLVGEYPDAIVYRLQFYTPFPGTELFEFVAKQGMKLPDSLDRWADYHYDKINLDNFDAGHRRFLEDFRYYTTFLDKKLTADRSRFARLISSFYSYLLDFRLGHGLYSCRFELLPLRIGKQIKKRVLRQC